MKAASPSTISETSSTSSEKPLWDWSGAREKGPFASLRCSRSILWLIAAGSPLPRRQRREREKAFRKAQLDERTKRKRSGAGLHATAHPRPNTGNTFQCTHTHLLSRVSCYETIWFHLEALRIVERACRISEVVPWRLGPAPRAQTKESHRSLTGDRRRSQSVRPRLGVREVKRHLWTRPALNMALILRPRHRRPRMDRRAAPLVKWAMHSARPNFTSAAHRE